uniref:Transposon Ty3-I Gag-Pol polyprotein n=1 Tax=Cajanus cajan TaxID=3821 RepID=A0A151RV81_CAJCA|nr:Transposon Ty3-I Gag-Pol polyprotein [Cajanus cajan]
MVLKQHSSTESASSNNGHNQPFQVRSVKLDFPRFDGSEVLQWIFKAEQFFSYYRTPDDQRLLIASIHLDKDVVPWYQMMIREHPFHSWIAFTRALEMEFGPSPYEGPRSQLFKLTQTNSVQAYYVQFTALANRVQGVTQEALLDCFVGGLKPDIRRDVIAQSPPSLLRTVSLAKLYEEKYTIKPKPFSSSFFQKNQTTNTNQTTPQSLKSTSLPPLLPSPDSKPTYVKKLTSAEMQLRRDKGICFTCDDKFSPNHRCPNKQYFVLQWEEDDEPELQPEPPDVIEAVMGTGSQDHHLSYNALNGSSGLGTMKFQGSINGVRVQILLDSGSSDNFLQPRIAQCLKIPVEPIPNLQVLVGNGNSLVAEGLIRDLGVRIQGHTLKLPVYLLPVSGADLVLGAAWLATIGPHISNYSTLTLKFYLGNQFITLYGQKPSLPQPAQFNHMRRMQHTHAIAELFTLQFSHIDAPNDQLLYFPADMEPELAMLLYTYRTVFDVPSGLPPRFLGLTGYYRKFIKGYASIAAPLSNLLKKESFHWTEQTTAAFENLKAAVTKAPVLALPDFSKLFTLETDASGIGIGAVLNKPGKENLAADCLSRSFFMAWSEPKLQIVHVLKEALQADLQLQSIKELCLQNKAPDPHYSVHDQLLYWKGRLVIPNSHNLVKQILYEFHTSLLGGHAGMARTLARISAQFYWSGMQKDVKEFVQQCLVCQQAKSATTLPAGLLQPLPIPMQIWEDLAMDFITGLPLSHGFTVILVVIDRLSKYAHFFTMKTDYTSKQVAEIFVKNVVKLHGFPKTIVSDRDKVFTSQFWQHLFKLSGTTINLTTAYHPQSDGQSEALNKCLEMYLRCFTHDSPKDWAQLLPWAEFWYNTACHNSSGMTPFKVVYGRDPPKLIKYTVDQADPVSLQEQLLTRDLTINKLKQNLHKAQGHMKKYADQKRRQLEFQIGDLVLVKLQPYRQHSVALRKNQKLSLRYFGPFPVIERIGLVAYKLLLPSTTKIHPVFHVSQLKPCKGEHTTPYIPFPFTNVKVQPIIQPAKILKERVIVQGQQQVPQKLVQWQGFENEQATWEDTTALQQAFPDFNLEDKVNLKGGGIVTRQNMIKESLAEKESEEHVEEWKLRARKGSRPKITNTKLKDYHWLKE